MDDKIITIAVDAMGGDGSPKKIIDGINAVSYTHLTLPTT